MKKILIFTIIILIFNACQDYLDEKYVSNLTQKYYETPEGLKTLVYSTYQILRFKSDYNQGHYLFGTCTDVEVFKWTNNDRISMGSYAADAWGADVSSGTRMTPMVNMLIGGVSGGFSEGAYPVINRCNIFLKNYEKLKSTEQENLKQFKGEILFLRTYAYYLLTNVLGPVPLILEPLGEMPSNFFYKKATLEEIYKRMIFDLRTAIDLLPTSTNQLGRITKMAAAHLLAKLYLHRAQAANWENSPEDHLRLLYKGKYNSDLDSCIYFATMVIDEMSKNNPAYGGLQSDFSELWKNIKDNYDRDKCKEIILSAQYEPTQSYNGRYGNVLVHLYNSNHTSLRACTPRTIDYGRPYATAGPTDWATDMYDHVNDSRYYKTFLTDYIATDPTETGGKPWDKGTALYYNTYLLPIYGGDSAKLDGKSKIKYGKRSIVYIENSKDEPFDSLWVVSQPYIMMVRWMVGSPANKPYFIKDNKGNIIGLNPEAVVDPANPIVTDYKSQGRKLMYRISGDKGNAFGLDRVTDVAQWYIGPRKWLDINRGKGSDPNGNGAIDVPLMRLAETYLIRAEAYGRKGDFAKAIDDINILRKRAAYKAGEKRSDVVVALEPGVITGRIYLDPEEKTAPYTVKENTYDKIKVTGEEWSDPASLKAIRENYPPTAQTELERFIHFIYNERARELIFELTNWEDLHNAGILYERVYYRDEMGAPITSTGTINFPFPKDDISTGNKGALGYGKGFFDKHHTFKPWPVSFLKLLTDENGNPLTDEQIKNFQNPGY